ncbi:probable transcription factor At5g61620 [Actinidia eriantha]|uniref:probable transcription factor At5g61620 n=1 Tax=Actinidia eriantha TaxID=165200 RepID=UPI0025850205|nr:probable transcription factor At5g61620 [Actinidia eriantha]
MVKESARKCSHCGHNGHNSRTCNGKACMKLFGVTIVAQREDESMRKIKSTGDLMACNGEHSALDAGYLSDGLVHSWRAKEVHERKKGVPWTEDEHRSFLAGLEKLGKGDWRGIAKKFVPSRTPTQVASHAQKYFIRLASTDKKKHRSSLFDMSFAEPEIHHSPPQEPPDKSTETPQQADNSPAAANTNNFCHTQGQAITSAQVVSPMETPLIFPRPSHMPYMPLVGGKIVPTVSFVPVMNFPNHGYFYMPKGLGNHATCAPYMSQPPSCFLSQPFLHGPSQAGPETSETKKDSLEFHIGVI